MSRIFIYCIFITLNALPFFNLAQTFGSSTFGSINALYNARAIGLGGNFFSVANQDVASGISNASLINEASINKLSISQIIQPIGVQYGMISYGSQLSKDRKLYQLSSLRYVNYGRMNETDVSGATIGTFNPLDVFLTHGVGFQMSPKLSFGCQSTLIGGFYLDQVQLGIGFDISGTWLLNENTSVAGLIKNIGVQKILSPSYPTGLLPFEIQASASHKLKYAPFRFSLLLHHLNKFDISYFNPNEKGGVDIMTGEKILPKENSIADKIVQHIVPQAEILLGKSFELRVGYNFYTRFNNAVPGNPSFSGLSFGIGMYFQRFSLDYGFKRMAASGSFNAVSLQIYLNEWRKK